MVKTLEKWISNFKHDSNVYKSISGLQSQTFCEMKKGKNPPSKPTID